MVADEQWMRSTALNAEWHQKQRGNGTTTAK